MVSEQEIVSSVVLAFMSIPALPKIVPFCSVATLGIRRFVFTSSYAKYDWYDNYKNPPSQDGGLHIIQGRQENSLG